MIKINLLNGYCEQQLKTLPDNSVDSIVTDPPYGLSFMGKAWDYEVPKADVWREALRVLKPGGHLLSFFGTRTYHRGVVNIEDAGFEIRDQIMWIYGSGFPKSHNIGKAIDKQAGAEREVISRTPTKVGVFSHSGKGTPQDIQDYEHIVTAPATKAVKQWDGWGTALKPANEPIVVARKPLEKGLTIADNVIKWGCGAINIDASRIEAEDQAVLDAAVKRMTGNKVTGWVSSGSESVKPVSAQGRWPANIILDEEAAMALDEQTQHLHGAGSQRSGGKAKQDQGGGLFGVGQHEGNGMRFGDSGGASRFFYVAKASKSERNKGLEGEVKQKQGARPNSSDLSGKFPDHDHRESGGNNHPTVKPVKLMEYLIKLVTPPNGTVLDPFMGSGTTGVAAKSLGFNFIGCELSDEYLEIAQKRIDHAGYESKD